jgi:hypothetical protein
VEITPTLGIGWLQGTLRGSIDECRDRLTSVLGRWEERDGGTKWYRRSASLGDLGAMLAWEPRGSANRPNEILVIVPQSSLDVLGWDAGVELYGLLVDVLGLRVSRLDLYYDDAERVVDPRAVLDAINDGRAVTHARYTRAVSDSNDGWTTYVGRRSSEQMLRCYRKWAESGDDTAGVRWELELRGPRAVAVSEAVLTSEAPARAFWGVLRGFIDFRERVGVQNGDRAPLVDWWARLIGSADRVVLATARRVESLHRRMQWLIRQAAPALASVMVAHGEVWIAQLLDDGVRRMRPRDWAMAGMET